MRRASLGLLLAPLLGACGSASEPAPSGLDEPVRVRFAPAGQTANVVPGQFFPGPLPSGTLGPSVSISNNQVVVFPGQVGKHITGDAGAGATGIGMKFPEFGSGFWVAPVGIEDANMPGSLIWELILDFGRNVPFGSHLVQIAAVDGDGRWGPPGETSLFFQSLQPSGAAVASLSWDSNADLDLQVITPSGVIDAKHVSGDLRVDGGVAPGAGMLDHDSNASCIPDGRRREDVIWSDIPTPGLYLARVGMFSACGEPATNFLFELYVQNELQLSLPGRLIAIDADNGAGPGLAITNFQF